jgi:hypothetical protein
MEFGRRAPIARSKLVTVLRVTSPYLNRPLLRLAVALPRMLAKIETELSDETASAADNSRLRQRAELIRSLLAPWPITQEPPRSRVAPG